MGSHVALLPWDTALGSEGHLESPPPLGAPWPVFSRHRGTLVGVLWPVHGPRVHRLLGWEPQDGCCLWLPSAPEVCAGLRTPHLDLHRVLRLGFLGVQELNGHDHLPFALEEHHLGEGGGQTQTLFLRVLGFWTSEVPQLATLGPGWLLFLVCRRPPSRPHVFLRV